LKKYAFKVVVSPLFKVFEVASELAIPIMVKLLIDVGLQNRDMNYIWTIGILMVSSALLGFLATLVTQYLASRVSADFIYDMREAITRKADAISEGTLDAFGKQKVLTLIGSDSNAIMVGLARFMRLLVRAPLLLIGSIAIAFFLDFTSGCVFLAVLSLSSLAILAVMILAPKRFARIQNDLDRISGLANDDLQGARPIRAFGKEKDENDRFSTSTSEYRRASIGVALLTALNSPLTWVFVNLGVAMIVYFGSLEINAGSFSTGDLVALTNLLGQALWALAAMSRLIVSFSQSLASQKRIDSFLALPDTPKGGTLIVEPSSEAPLLEFRHVFFAYGEGEKAANDVSFVLRRGEKIGIIGPTGSGKSTLASLIERFLEPSSGEILLNGRDIRLYDLQALRSQISFVSQKPSIFSGTIRSNLLLGNPTATEAEIKKALALSLAEEFVSRYPDGLGHPLEEGGGNLSGGQKQRLLIARALLAKPSLLILDDATSALDYLSEQKVRTNLWGIEGLSLIAISQKTSTLSPCDEILVLESGAVKERGSQAALLAEGGLYKTIYETQGSRL
jgi:ATP-binding cassette subfamily B protein